MVETARKMARPFEHSEDETASSSLGPEVTASGLRPIVDFLVCLAMWVIVVRGFGVEGYIISTGSMAPHLLGYHKRAVCPSCGTLFAVGVSRQAPSNAHRLATCPNCGAGNIDIADVPVNAGDQLLVHKNAFQFRPPRRWDVVVFRNPDKPTQAYVKRVVGFPGEQIQIRDGDLLVNGVVQRKSLSRQEAMRLPVYDFDHRPELGPAWQSRWIPHSGWQADGSGFVLEDTSSEQTRRTSYRWLTYRHWIRSGGTHRTSVSVRPWPSGVGTQDITGDTVHLDATDGQITCRGVLSSALRDRLMSIAQTPTWREAVARLEEESHIAPITDDYGHNVTNPARRHFIVPDLMFECRVVVQGGNGRLVVRMLDGQHVYDTIWDVRAGLFHLLVDGNQRPVRTARCHPETLPEGVFLQMSTIDRQVVVAVNGDALLQYPVDPRRSAVTSNAPSYQNPRHALAEPVRVGGRSLAVQIDSLRLFRDVYYTAGDGRRGVSEPYRLGADQYFFLGDNSPVSLDSRSWDNPDVTRAMIIGRPLLLHLPSRPGKIQLGQYVAHIRIPDFSRIRYIH